MFEISHELTQIFTKSIYLDIYKAQVTIRWILVEAASARLSSS